MIFLILMRGWGSLLDWNWNWRMWDGIGDLRTRREENEEGEEKDSEKEEA